MSVVVALLIAILVPLLSLGSAAVSPWGPWLLTSGLGAGVLVLHRPALALALLVLLLPLSPALPGSPVSHLVDYGLPALAFSLMLVASRAGDRRVEPPTRPLITWFFLFLIWTLFTGLLSTDPRQAILQSMRIGTLFVVLIAFRNLWSTDGLGRLLLAYAFLMVPIAAFGIWQMASRGVAEVLFARALSPDRLSSIYFNPNTFGTVVAHAIVLLLPFLLVRLRRRSAADVARSLALVSCLVVLGLGLLTSFSRGSLLYAGTGGLTALLAFRQLRPWIAGGAVLLSAWLFLLPIPQWLFAGLRLGAGISLRDALWGAGWRMMIDHPWTGVGSGTRVFETHRPWYVDTDAFRALSTTTGGAAHNVFLSKGAELGIPGLILAVALFLLLLRHVPPALARLPRGDWLSGAAAAGVVGLTFRALFETGTTLGSFHATDSLHFFLFAMILLGWSRSGPEPDRNR